MNMQISSRWWWAVMPGVGAALAGWASMVAQAGTGEGMEAESAKTSVAVASQPDEPVMTRARFIVCEGSRNGPRAKAAEVELIAVSQDKGVEEPLGKGTTDDQGHVELQIPEEIGASSYQLLIHYGGQTRMVALERLPRSEPFTLLGPVRAPAPLIRVTLEADEDLSIVPILTLGIDTVHTARTDSASDEGVHRVSVEGLPGGILWLMMGNERPLPLVNADHEQTLRLKTNESTLFINGSPAFVDFTKLDDPQAWVTRNARNLSKLRCVAVEWDNKSLPVLQALAGTGIGVFLNTGQGNASPVLVEALARIQARHAVISSRDFSALTQRSLTGALFRLWAALTADSESVVGVHALSSVETLYLVLDQAHNQLPDLSNLPQLRHLLLFRDSKTTFDMSRLEQLVQLRAVTVFAAEAKIRNTDTLGALTELQFLTIASNEPCPISSWARWPRLQYLGAEFPVDTDFAFVERLPYLQTLVISNLDQRHRLEPAGNAPRLRYLGVPKETLEYQNVDHFRRAHPRIQVVETDLGLCLGSFWLLPAALAAVLVALAARRLRRRLRPAAA